MSDFFIIRQKPLPFLHQKCVTLAKCIEWMYRMQKLGLMITQLMMSTENRTFLSAPPPPDQPAHDVLRPLNIPSRSQITLPSHNTWRESPSSTTSSGCQDKFLSSFKIKERSLLYEIVFTYLEESYNLSREIAYFI